jgi:hypothetical protein
LALTVGIAVTGFCHPGGILQLFHQEDQQISRLPIAVARSLQQIHLLQVDFIINKEERIKLQTTESIKVLGISL